MCGLGRCAAAGDSDGQVACYRPVKGYRDEGGRIRFPRPGSSLRREPIVVPCGQCIGCRLERSRQWALRCMHEASLHRRNCFVTLTYDDDHLPGDGSLDVRHWQLFAKRVRNRVGPFRFFHCGEYGDLYGRPHYHAAIFNQDFAGDRVPHSRNQQGDVLYTSEALDECWDGRGIAVVGELTFESAAYIARYCVKKQTGLAAKDGYEWVSTKTGECQRKRVAPYTTMSRGGRGANGKGGIGKSWFERYYMDCYPKDFVTENGRKQKPPKYYDGLYEIKDPCGYAAVKEKRKEVAEARAEHESTERLRVRERVARKKLETFNKRRLQ